MKFQINLREVIYTLSDALDLVGINNIHHGKRVAYMAAECGKAFGFDKRQLDNLFHAAILHDFGVSSTQMHTHLVTFLDWEDSDLHCIIGTNLLRNCEPFIELAPLIKYHHTHWDDPEYNDISPVTRLQSNLIFLCDRIDALILFHNDLPILNAKDYILDEIGNLTGTFFSPELVDTFRKVSQTEVFWLRLESNQISEYFNEWQEREEQREVDYKTIEDIASFFSYIVDTKSNFTSEHSAGVARIAKRLGELYGLSDKRCNMLKIAGLLHDIGKLRVPDEILEKRGDYTDRELAIMRQHSFDTHVILSKITGMEEIAEWASSHHEKLNGKGYPYHKTEQELPIESRIIAVADVFQALIQDRPYRHSIELVDAYAILEDMTKKNQIDNTIVNLIGNNLASFWKLSNSDDMEAILYDYHSSI